MRLEACPGAQQLRCSCVPTHICILVTAINGQSTCCHLENTSHCNKDHVLVGGRGKGGGGGGGGEEKGEWEEGIKYMHMHTSTHIHAH